MKLLTASLEGKALDWALGMALQVEKLQFIDGGVIYRPSSGGRQMFSHTDPKICLRLTDKINIMQQANDGSWRVAAFCVKGKKHKAHGKTLEEAVARCVVQMRLGDEVDVPDEMVQSEHSRPSSDDYKYCHNHD